MLAASMAAVGIITTVSAPAQAAGTERYHAYAYDPAYPVGAVMTGDAQFASINDHFWLTDDTFDGHGVVLHINLSDDAGETYHRWKNLYNGDERTEGVLRYKVWDFDAEFSEGRYFAFQVCRQDGINQESFHCGDWVKGTA
ncbi:hypothetical protein [Streptomyces sp. NPDC001530]|uniref:hypothetical protein n=1 Tax=Streptomyces sp. NPDC001530 TaxID=3364582 RepID=UPI0036B5AB03